MAKHSREYLSIEMLISEGAKTSSRGRRLGRHTWLYAGYYEQEKLSWTMNLTVLPFAAASRANNR